jgi:hypothetical protein
MSLVTKDDGDGYSGGVQNGFVEGLPFVEDSFEQCSM